MPADFSTVRVVSPSPGALNNELLFCHQSADNLLRNNPGVTTKQRVKASVTVTAVILLKDISHDHTYFCIFIAQALAGFVVKITAAGISNGVHFLKGINDLGFLPVFQGQKVDAQVLFISSFAFVSMSRSSCS